MWLLGGYRGAYCNPLRQMSVVYCICIMICIQWPRHQRHSQPLIQLAEIRSRFRVIASFVSAALPAFLLELLVIGLDGGGEDGERSKKPEKIFYFRSVISL